MTAILYRTALSVIVLTGLIYGSDVRAQTAEMGNPKSFSELAGLLLKDVDVSKQKIRVGVLAFGSVGGGEAPAALEAAAKLVRAEMEKAFSDSPGLDVIARDRLADLELESDFQNKRVEIKDVDMLSRGNLFYKGRSVSIHAELVFLDGRKKSASLELEPGALGLLKRAPEEIELPPALASIRISDQSLFDIKMTQVKIAGIQSRLKVVGVMSKEDQAAVSLVLKRALETRHAELKIAADKVVGELGKLAELDRTIVEQSFAERRSELILKAAEEGLDTDLQRRLLGKLEGLFQKAVKSGVKVLPMGILELTRDDE